ncbi:MAG: DUF6586 family protein [Endozoicomonas sp.]
MTNNWQGFTNKMLFHSRLLMEAWKEADEVAGPAFREACLGAMVQAYRSLLAEIMTNYRLSVSQPPTLDEAINSIHLKGEVSSELQYIEQLEQHESWLSSLLRSHQECLMPTQRKVLERFSGIPLVSASAMDLELPDSAASILVSLKELVIYSRNFSLEW